MTIVPSDEKRVMELKMDFWADVTAEKQTPNNLQNAFNKIPYRIGLELSGLGA